MVLWYSYKHSATRKSAEQGSCIESNTREAELAGFSFIPLPQHFKLSQWVPLPCKHLETPSAGSWCSVVREPCWRTPPSVRWVPRQESKAQFAHSSVMGKGLTSTQHHYTTPRGQTPLSPQQRLFYIGRARPRRRPEPQLATAGRGRGSGSRGGRWRMRHWRLVGCAGSRGCGGGRWRHGEREGSGGGGGCVSEGRLYFLLPFPSPASSLLLLPPLSAFSFPSVLLSLLSVLSLLSSAGPRCGPGGVSWWLAGAARAARGPLRAEPRAWCCGRARATAAFAISASPLTL